MDLSTIRFLPRRRETPPNVTEKWNPRLDDLFGPGKFRFVFGASLLVCEGGSWRMKYPDVNRPTETVIHYRLSTPEGDVEVESADERDWPEHLQDYKGGLLLPVTYHEQEGVELWILEGFIGERADPGEPENVWSEIARLTDRHGQYREPEQSDIERIQELVRKQSMDSILRDVRWDSGKDYKVASARSERTYKADLDKREEDVARAEEDAAKYVEKIRESDGRVIFTP